MVKSLHLTAKTVKWLTLLLALCVIWGAIWLQSGVHSLNALKPLILSSVNSDGAPYDITVGDITIDWTRTTEFGQLRLTQVTFAKKGGTVFAQLPNVYATIDFLGFLPHRKMLHTVTLHEAQLFLTRKEDHQLYVGIEGADSVMPLASLMASFATGKEPNQRAALTLPFKNLVIDKAKLTFHDERRSEDIVAEDVELRLTRHWRNYVAKLKAPYQYDGGQGLLIATLLPDPGVDDYHIDLSLEQFPARFICTFMTCPDNLGVRGKMNIGARIGLMAHGGITGIKAALASAQMELKAPEWFAAPLTLTELKGLAEYDARTGQLRVPDMHFEMTDTGIKLLVNAEKKPDGWYVNADAALTRALDVTQLYKYWPLAMAPGSREWVTSKLKSGRADTASLKLMLTPQDMAAGQNISDASLSAEVAARDITVDYLPGFPNILHLNGDVRFTGTTVTIDGYDGTLLTGTKVKKAKLICPDLNHPNVPMIANLSIDAPASDAATFLALKHFAFDDGLSLDPATATGSGAATITLKFNSFSNTVNSDPNALHFESVDYDITTDITNFAQTGFAGGYSVKNLSGTLKANLQGLQFNGALALGESGLSDVMLSQPSGKPLNVSVKTQAPLAGKPSNDFSLTYASGKVPSISIKGKRLDATAKYDAAEHNTLKDFPKLKLNIDLDQLFLSPGAPFSNVQGTLHCGARCESGKLTANIGKGIVVGEITHQQGTRGLTITAGDAGAFLKALNVTDRMSKGRFELRGGYDDSKSPAPYTGRLIIEEFSLKNSQILGRILAIGSLSGLANALTGSGIMFEKFGVTLHSDKGLVTVSDGKASGAAMGITVEGAVNTTNTALGLKGVVVPAYALNSAIGKIPIVGAIAGGEGEGLIAFNYSVKGTYDKPDVSVNPLSGLTPGFLRGIFGIFETKNPDMESATPKETPDAPATATDNPVENP